MRVKSCNSALLQLSVRSSDLSVVGGRKDTVEKLREGEIDTCSCMKAELLYRILMEHTKLVCVCECLKEADAGQVQ